MKAFSHFIRQVKHLFLLVMLTSLSLIGLPAMTQMKPYVLKHVDPRLSQEELGQITQIINGINQEFPSLPRPKSVPISIERHQNRFSYNLSGLHIGYSYQKNNKKAGFDQVQYAIAHEWGHALFYAGMSERSAHWTQFIHLWKEKESAPRAMSELVRQRRKRLNSKVSESSDQKKDDFLEQFPTRIAELKKQTLDTAKAFRNHFLYRYNKPYNELFADLLTTLYFEDLEAMSKSLHFTLVGQKRQLDPHGYRGFRCHKARPRPQNPNIYQVFADVRCHLGKTYLHRGLNQDKKNQILQGTLRAIAKEFDFITEQTSEKKPSGKTLNRRLIQSLDKELAHLL